MNPIREAIKNLSGHWYQGSLGDGRGNYCGVGHVRNTVSYEDVEGWDVFYRALRILHTVAAEQYPERMSDNAVPSFPEFNDHPDTTEEDVIAVMEKAAVRFEEQV